MNQISEKTVPSSDPSDADSPSEETAVVKSDSLQDEDGVRLNKDVVLKTTDRLPQLDKGDIKAYRAVGSQKIATNLFAYVCDKSLSPRLNNVSKYASLINPNLVPLVASGKAAWEDGIERYCFVFENVLGNPLVPRDQQSIALGLKPDMVMANIVKPMIYLLLDLRNKDIVHGEIWPGNMFDGGLATKDKIRLGECLTCPASSQLPALYEPIERAMADPMGRGIGSGADDLYAFGVTLAVMMRGSDPLAGLSDDEVVTQKIEKGSYAALIGKERFSGAILELLRGLLYDDKAQRWTLDEVQAWMDGRRLSPKQSPKRIKANRPLLYDDKKFTRPEILAKVLHTKPFLTAKLVESGELEVWLERAIEDKTLKGRMERTNDDIAALEKGDGYADRLSARVAITLNPDAPIRYKGLSFMPDGFGKYFSSMVAKDKNIQPFIDVIRGSFLLQIIRQKSDIDQSALIGRYDSCRSYIAQTKFGSGLERCIYYLDPDCPCLSVALANYYVQSPEELIRALEKLAQEEQKPKRIIDRHIAAFLSVKDRKNIDPYIIEFGGEDKARRALAELKTLATIQKRSKLENFPNLAKWVVKGLEPVYENFHDRERRKTMRQNVSKIAKTGDLTRLAAMFDNEHLYENDRYMFEQAQEHFLELAREKTYLQKKLEERKGFGEKTGQQIASFVSLAIALFVICVIAFVKIQGQG